MSIDFSKLTGWSTSKGAVTQVADSQGRIIWMLQSGDTVILEVAKITSDTYAGETTYTGEQFILMDIYPKTNGTVKVTYGGLTKTITDTSGVAEPNAQQVFFGTFNGVSDSVTTPTSGRLTIDGEYYAFGCSSYKMSSKVPGYYNGINSVIDLGVITHIPGNAFYRCSTITDVHIPDSVTYIYQTEGTLKCTTFEDCYALTNITVDDENAHYSSENGVLFNKDKTLLIYCPNFEGEYTIPYSVNTIASSAFKDCEKLTSVTFANPSTWSVINMSTNSSFGTVDVTDSANNVTLLTSTYPYLWKRN